MVAGAAKVRVTYQVDADGLLSVTAQELSTQVEAHVTVKPSYGLSDIAIAEMLKNSIAHSSDDERERMVREKRIDAQRMLDAVKKALEADGALLNEEESQKISELMKLLESCVDSSSAAEIQIAIDALNEGTQEFAGRRMDKSIREALRGRNIDQI